MKPGPSIPSPSLTPPPAWRLVKPGAATIDNGRSNKAGRLRGHLGAAHTVTPAITSAVFAGPLLIWLAGQGASRLPYLLIITAIEGRLRNQCRWIKLRAEEERKHHQHQDIGWNGVPWDTIML